MAPQLRFRHWLPWLLAVSLTLGAWGAWRLWGPELTAGRHPIVLSLEGPERWEGVAPAQRLGILLIIKDHLEVFQGRTVVEEANLGAPLDGSIAQVTLGGRRSGNELALEIHCLGPGKREARWSLPLASPQATLQAFLAHFGAKADPGMGLLTREPRNFWDLAEATGTPIDGDPLGPMHLAEDLVRREPQCAGAWATLAFLTYWQLAREGGRADTEDYHRCDALFRHTLAMVPHYPRAVDDFAGYKTDTGDSREALKTTLAALKKYPRVAHLHGALAYPARISGLLEGASRAIRARDALAGFHRFERDQVENTHLYRGDWDLFARSLGPGSDALPEPSRDFYRGYVHLLTGHREQARFFFARAHSRPGGWVQFEVLARVFEHALAGDREGALRELRALKAERARLRVPDGEFTFKLAEAFGFLGEPDEALETANRAFAQGFGCTRWYQESPFLSRIPREARWNALLQHLQERQHLMEEAFPARRFGPR